MEPFAFLGVLLALGMILNSCFLHSVQAARAFALSKDEVNGFLESAGSEKRFQKWVLPTGGEESPGVHGSDTIQYMQGLQISKYMIVDQQGGGHFKTVQAAVDSVPVGNSQWVYIQINAGIYREKVCIDYNKPYIIFQGAGRSQTVISWGDTAAGEGTANSATFSALASNFIAKGIGFQNTAQPPPPGAQNRQAVAALLSGDMAAFYSCGFYGALTLFDYQGRHYFKDSYIEGSIDFIFGHAQSMFRGCELHAIAESTGSLTAQNRWNPSENSGFVFVNCIISGTGQIFLGRAWGAYSRVIFLYTFMNNIILPEGWYDWGDPGRQETVFYGQYKCSGPGSSEGARVKWSHELSDQEAQPFLQVDFIDGQSWLQEV